MIYLLVKKPPLNGKTTKRITERIRVSYGTLILLIPSRNATIGVKAASITRSFTAT